MAQTQNGPDAWEYSIRRTVDDSGNVRLWLDADPCPECGSQIVNATIEQSVQFVGAPRAADGPEPDRELHQADDGPHSPELSYAWCGSCETLLSRN